MAVLLFHRLGPVGGIARKQNSIFHRKQSKDPNPVKENPVMENELSVVDGYGVIFDPPYNEFIIESPYLKPSAITTIATPTHQNAHARPNLNPNKKMRASSP